MSKKCTPPRSTLAALGGALRLSHMDADGDFSQSPQFGAKPPCLPPAEDHEPESKGKSKGKGKTSVVPKKE